uniref:Uncharacterized protein n=1 Tax=Meloidogyne enterolobii TaxID=390850 RepID=A0A6V7YAJ5_MELEN|nr:unnamed protein product [Meloidogyne enterolobii]
MNELKMEDELNLSSCLNHIFAEFNQPETNNKHLKSKHLKLFKNSMKAKERSRLLELLIKNRNQSLAERLYFALNSGAIKKK